MSFFLTRSKAELLTAELAGAQERIAELEAQLDAGRPGVPSIDERIQLITAEVEPVRKRRADDGEGFDSIAAADVLAAVREPMLRHGLGVTPSVVGGPTLHDLVDPETGNVIKNRLTQIELDFRLADPKSEVAPFHRRWVAEAADGHAIKKALTEGVKSFYIHLFQIRVLPPDSPRPAARARGRATVSDAEQRRRSRREAELERPISNVMIGQIIRPIQGDRTDDQVDELVRDQFGVDGLELLPRKHVNDLKHVLLGNGV